MELIVAVDKNWGIGYKGELLCRVSADLKNFRALTTGKTVILGSKTLATFPGGRPLKNRKNIILSRNPAYYVEGAMIAHSAKEALSMIEQDEDAVVIGGQSIYSLMLPYCDKATVTVFDRAFTADAFFPNLDEDGEWTLESESQAFTAEDTDSAPGMKYTFRVYRRIKTRHSDQGSL